MSQAPGAPPGCCPGEGPPAHSGASPVPRKGPAYWEGCFPNPIEGLPTAQLVPARQHGQEQTGCGSGGLLFLQVRSQTAGLLAAGAAGGVGERLPHGLQELTCPSSGQEGSRDGVLCSQWCLLLAGLGTPHPGRPPPQPSPGPPTAAQVPSAATSLVSLSMVLNPQLPGLDPSLPLRPQ